MTGCARRGFDSMEGSDAATTTPAATLHRSTHSGHWLGSLRLTFAFTRSSSRDLDALDVCRRQEPARLVRQSDA